MGILDLFRPNAPLEALATDAAPPPTGPALPMWLCHNCGRVLGMHDMDASAECCPGVPASLVDGRTIKMGPDGLAIGAVRL